MSRFETSIPADYFNSMYAADSDPWRFAESDYEREKYAATLAALPRQAYSRALEVGCSIGVLTSQLAGRCTSLLAIDVAEAALAQAKRRCAGLPQVQFVQSRVPAEWPAGCYDLILLSEVVYYLDRQDLERLVACVRSSIAPGGDIVLVHWLGETHYPLSGDQAAELFTAASVGFAQIRFQSRTEAYRIDVLRAETDSAAVAR